MIIYYSQQDIDAINSPPSVASLFPGLSTPGWYFWDENETLATGPFLDQQIASEALEKYLSTPEKPND